MKEAKTSIFIMLLSLAISRRQIEIFTEGKRLLFFLDADPSKDLDVGAEVDFGLALGRDVWN